MTKYVGNYYVHLQSHKRQLYSSITIASQSDWLPLQDYPLFAYKVGGHSIIKVTGRGGGGGGAALRLEQSNIYNYYLERTRHRIFYALGDMRPHLFKP